MYFQVMRYLPDLHTWKFQCLTSYHNFTTNYIAYLVCLTDNSVICNCHTLGFLIKLIQKGARQDPANYRSVSLTSICQSIVSSAILSNTLKLTTFSLIVSMGFRARRSCETQIITLLHELSSSLDKGTQTLLL